MIEKHLLVLLYCRVLFQVTYEWVIRLTLSNLVVTYVSMASVKVQSLRRYLWSNILLSYRQRQLKCPWSLWSFEFLSLYDPLQMNWKRLMSCNWKSHDILTSIGRSAASFWSYHCPVRDGRRDMVWPPYLLFSTFVSTVSYFQTYRSRHDSRPPCRF